MTSKADLDQLLTLCGVLKTMSIIKMLDDVRADIDNMSNDQRIVLNKAFISLRDADVGIRDIYRTCLRCLMKHPSMENPDDV